MFIRKRKFRVYIQVLVLSILMPFLGMGITPVVYAQNVANLPAPGVIIAPSVSYNPPMVMGITIYPENPLQFDFIIDAGDDNLQGEELRKESKKLINYFLATLTVPEDEMWVNLSPYEKDRIVADGLGVTEMGRDMLAQDYLLKQLTASLMYPEEDIGSEFWKRVYEKTQTRFGTTEIPTNTFNKIWIVPEKAVVYVNDNNVFVSESHLKVLLEEDYLALETNLDTEKHGVGTLTKNEIEEISAEAKQVIREVLIPEIEREVNEGKNFANLRQIYNSMILATWHKKNMKEGLLGQVYANGNKTNGIELEDKTVKEKIYNQYVEAFKKGVYNYIKEDYDPVSKEIIPRKYFSGGLLGHTTETVVEGNESSSPLVAERFADATPEYRARIVLDMTDASGEVVDASSPIDGNLDETKMLTANRKVLLTASPRTGKSTVIQKLLSKLEGQKVVGFYTREIRQDSEDGSEGDRVGFEMVSVDGTQREVVAHVDFTDKDEKLGRYGIDLDVVRRFALELNRKAQDADVVIIDEIGKMQVLSSELRDILQDIFQSNAVVVATVPVAEHSNEFIEGLKRREAIDLVEVTVDNRDGLVEEIADRLSKQAVVESHISQVQTINSAISEDNKTNGVEWDYWAEDRERDDERVRRAIEQKFGGVPIIQEGLIEFV